MKRNYFFIVHLVSMVHWALKSVSIAYIGLFGSLGQSLTPKPQTSVKRPQDQSLNSCSGDHGTGNGSSGSPRILGLTSYIGLVGGDQNVCKGYKMVARMQGLRRICSPEIFLRRPYSPEPKPETLNPRP